MADEPDEISTGIRQLSDRAELVLSTGGTGVAPRRDAGGDARPDRPRGAGHPEAIRAVGAARTPHGLLSRGIAGTLGGALVVNLPGSPGGCRDGYAVMRPVLDHALRLLADEPTAHRQT